MWYRAFIRKSKPEEMVKSECFHGRLDVEWKDVTRERVWAKSDELG